MSESGPLPGGFRIVGIGASAGGLESLERFFARVPPDTGMAFVVLQHLSPDFKNLMDELLGRRTSMPVRVAEHETLLEPNVVLSAAADEGDDRSEAASAAERSRSAPRVKILATDVHKTSLEFASAGV